MDYLFSNRLYWLSRMENGLRSFYIVPYLGRNIIAARFWPTGHGREEPPTILHSGDALNVDLFTGGSKAGEVAGSPEFTQYGHLYGAHVADGSQLGRYQTVEWIPGYTGGIAFGSHGAQPDDPIISLR